MSKAAGRILTDKMADGSSSSVEHFWAQHGVLSAQVRVKCIHADYGKITQCAVHALKTQSINSSHLDKMKYLGP